MKNFTVSFITILSGLLLSSCGTGSGVLHPVAVNGRYGYIDHAGKLAITPQFDAAGEFAENLAPVEMNGKWGYIDRSGKLTITPRFDLADPAIRN